MEKAWWKWAIIIGLRFFPKVFMAARHFRLHTNSVSAVCASDEMMPECGSNSPNLNFFGCKQIHVSSSIHRFAENEQIIHINIHWASSYYQQSLSPIVLVFLIDDRNADVRKAKWLITANFFVFIFFCAKNPELHNRIHVKWKRKIHKNENFKKIK